MQAACQLDTCPCASKDRRQGIRSDLEALTEMAGQHNFTEVGHTSLWQQPPLRPAGWVLLYDPDRHECSSIVSPPLF